MLKSNPSHNLSNKMSLFHNVLIFGTSQMSNRSLTCQVFLSFWGHLTSTRTYSFTHMHTQTHLCYLNEYLPLILHHLHMSILQIAALRMLCTNIVHHVYITQSGHSKHLQRLACSQIELNKEHYVQISYLKNAARL